MKCPNCGSEVAETAKFCINCGASIVQAQKESGAIVALYCRNCGARLPEGATHCTNCGTLVAGPPIAEQLPQLELARWEERFVAWIIDIILVGVVLLPIKWFLVWLAWPGLPWAPGLPRWIPFVDLGFDNVIHFLYWSFLEGTTGQSIGKRVMKTKVTRLSGEPLDITRAAIESLGKAFLLPIDCIIGWILYPSKKQRLFNYISETVTVKTSQ